MWESAAKSKPRTYLTQIKNALRTSISTRHNIKSRIHEHNKTENSTNCVAPFGYTRTWTRNRRLLHERTFTLFSFRSSSLLVICHIFVNMVAWMTSICDYFTFYEHTAYLVPTFISNIIDKNKFIPISYSSPPTHRHLPSTTKCSVIALPLLCITSNIDW